MIRRQWSSNDHIALAFTNFVNHHLEMTKRLDFVTWMNYCENLARTYELVLDSIKLLRGLKAKQNLQLIRKNCQIAAIILLLRQKGKQYERLRNGIVAFRTKEVILRLSLNNERVAFASQHLEERVFSSEDEGSINRMDGLL